MDDLCNVYRDFHPSDGSFLGNIELFVLPNNKIELQIMGLQDNDYADDGGQASVIIDYPSNIHLYDIITTVLDKITEDHQYMLRGVNPRDFIVCSPNLIQKHPELVNFDTTANTDGAPWMEFNRENVKYLGGCENCPSIEGGDSIIIYGNINQDGEFTYDYPIVSRAVDQEYYELTRGRCVWNIEYDSITRSYVECKVPHKE
jgi:hypothetical protein